MAFRPFGAAPAGAAASAARSTMGATRRSMRCDNAGARPGPEGCDPGYFGPRWPAEQPAGAGSVDDGAFPVALERVVLGPTRTGDPRALDVAVTHRHVER